MLQQTGRKLAVCVRDSRTTMSTEAYAHMATCLAPSAESCIYAQSTIAYVYTCVEGDEHTC